MAEIRTRPDTVPLTKLIEEFRRHADDLADDDLVDVGLQNLIKDIDHTLGRIERALADFRIALDAVTGRD